MSVLAEAAYGLYGALRLLRFDKSGARYFLNDGGAAWRSFRALWLFVPLYAGFLLLLNGNRFESGGAVLHYLGIKVAVQLVIMFAYLLITFHLLELMKRAQRFPAFVAAYNWATVVQTFIAIVGTGLALSPGLGLEGGQVVQAVLGLFILAYAGMVVKSVLELDWIFAVGLVALDMFVTHMVGSLSDAVLASLRG